LRVFSVCGLAVAGGAPLGREADADGRTVGAADAVAGSLVAASVTEVATDVGSACARRSAAAVLPVSPARSVVAAVALERSDGAGLT
jgi:hypothetical protein